MRKPWNKMQLQIMYNIRKEGRLSLYDLYSIFFGTQKPVWSSAEDILCVHLSNLCDIGFLDIIDENNKTVNAGSVYDEIKKYLSSALFGSGDASKRVFFKIANKLRKLQEKTGFSISDEIRDLQIYERQNAIFDQVNLHVHGDVFIAMPFNDAFNSIYEDHIEKVCNKKLLSCLRVDRIKRASSIINDIWSGINSAKVIIADCTGQNANVFYEIGLAHALGKPVILITQNLNDIPFDISRIRYIKYENSADGLTEFDATLSDFLREELLCI